MTDAEFSQFSRAFLNGIQSRTPVRTGNLKLNATKLRSIGKDKAKIFVDTEVAHYFKWVNNKPTVGKNDKENRNYKYFQKAIKATIEELGLPLGADVEVIE